MKHSETYDMPYVGCMMGSAFLRLIGQLDEALKRRHLHVTAGEYMILRALYTHDGLQQCEIAEMVGKDKSSVCRSVAAMVRKGLVETQPVSYKCVRVRLARKAIEIRPQIMEVAEERHKALETLVAPADLEAFCRVLKAILD